PKWRIHSGPLRWNPPARAQTVSVIVGSDDRARLRAIIGDRNRPLKRMPPVRLPITHIFGVIQ
ncbi:hypothetical protein, partial [Falsiroseomonas sp. E2-1-a20]|uniref:hypothetical protein n=1 Tax=Falsiroseomonas sp. E2-1-a20 TaxID=3239300 RepID=UPI003F2B1012